MAQRRRYERFLTDLSCRLYVPGTPDRSGKSTPKFEAFARMKDVSLGGALLTSQFRFRDPGDVVVELHLPDGPLAVNGRIVRQPDGAFGVEFFDVTLKHKERLLAHFISARHQAFFDAVVVDVLPKLGVDRVSLLLHLWDEWRAHNPEPEAGASAPVSASARSQPAAPAARPLPKPAPRPVVTKRRS